MVESGTYEVSNSCLNYFYTHSSASLGARVVFGRVGRLRWSRRGGSRIHAADYCYLKIYCAWETGILSILFIDSLNLIEYVI